MSQQCFFRFSLIVFMGLGGVSFVFLWEKGAFLGLVRRFFGACKALLRGIKVLFWVFLVV